MKSLALTEAEAIALKALAFLGGDAGRLERFLALSGLDVADLRTAADDPGFLNGVLDHLASDDSLMLDFAEESGIAPETALAARAALGGPESFD